MRRPHPLVWLTAAVIYFSALYWVPQFPNRDTIVSVACLALVAIVWVWDRLGARHEQPQSEEQADPELTLRHQMRGPVGGLLAAAIATWVVGRATDWPTWWYAAPFWTLFAAYLVWEWRAGRLRLRRCRRRDG